MGSAVASGFEGIDDVHLMLVDPHKYGDLSETIKDTTKEAQMIFLCLPTPSIKGEYDVDISIVDSVLSEIEDRFYDGIVVIKSTITPHHINDFIDKYFEVWPKIRTVGIRRICSGYIIFCGEQLKESNRVLSFIGQKCIASCASKLFNRRS